MEDIRKPRTSKTYPPVDWTKIVSEEIDISSLIKQLKQYGQTCKSKLNLLLDTSQHILYNEPNILQLTSPVRIVGDIHGQFYDLLFILQTYGDLPDQKYLFLGDYVDRGLFCIQVITLLLALKCKYPKNIFLLRGNHEGKTMTQHFNFKLECAKKYDIDIYERFLQLFCKLPLCAIVDRKYFCVHGGISPELKKLKQLVSINRFKQIDQSGLICDLLWSDPVNTNNNIWQKNKTRSCSYLFSRKQTQKFVNENKIQMIIRGHEVQMKGFAYQMSDYRTKLTLTIFSAPNYCDTYKNKGGIAIIKKGCLTIECFQQSPHPFVFPNYMNVLEWSLPNIANQTSKMFLHLLKMMEKTDNQSEEDIIALQKIQCLNSLLENKKKMNFQLILKQEKPAIKNQLDFESLFSHMKTNDQCQKYPHLPPPVIGPKNIQFKRIRINQQAEDFQNQLVQDLKT